MPERELRALQELRERPLNFDPAELGAGEGRWQHDVRTQPLRSEKPGGPEEGGAWEMARRLMRGYEFADPSIVRAFYDPDVPLERRDMLLEVRFHGLRFRVGCRVGEVYERTEQVDGRDALVWGWSYRTLQGHFEQGEMHWQVLKWPESGEVAFRIEAWSRRAQDPNPVVRLGFRLFGRREQLRFYASTCRRMRRLTGAAAGHGSTADAVRRTAAEVTEHPTRDAGRHHEELARNAAREDGREE